MACLIHSCSLGLRAQWESVNLETHGISRRMKLMLALSHQGEIEAVGEVCGVLDEVDLGLILTVPFVGHQASPSLSLFVAWEKEDDDYHYPSK